MFITIRLILWLMFLVPTVMIMLKNKSKSKKYIAIFTIILFTVLLTVSAMFPVENTFMDFKTPESVFRYVKFGNIDEIIYGKDSCMILFSKGNNARGFYIVPKTEKGYAIPSYFAINNKSHKFDKSGLFDVYRVKGTNDYYVFGTVHLKDDRNKIIAFDGNDQKNRMQYSSGRKYRFYIFLFRKLFQ